jgi:putative FmdB family regulatory protein
MPFYEYQCQGCGAHHEALQKMSDAPLKRCPACGKPKLQRLVSAPVFRLKGGGWYETDFKSDQERKRNLHAEDVAAPKSETEADKKKPAKAADSPKPAETPKASKSPAKKPAQKARPAGRKAAKAKR